MAGAGTAAITSLDARLASICTSASSLMLSIVFSGVDEEAVGAEAGVVPSFGGFRV